MLETLVADTPAPDFLVENRKTQEEATALFGVGGPVREWHLARANNRIRAAIERIVAEADTRPVLSAVDTLRGRRRGRSSKSCDSSRR